MYCALLYNINKNEIKSLVKSKVAPLVKKGINYVKDHPEIISKAVNYFANPESVEGYYPDDDDDNFETAGMIQPRFK